LIRRRTQVIARPSCQIADNRSFNVNSFVHRKPQSFCRPTSSISGARLWRVRWMRMLGDFINYLLT
jgi:hypothetical protein